MASAGLPDDLPPVLWGFPPSGASPPAKEVMPWEDLMPPLQAPLKINDELLPPRGVFGGTMQDEIVGATTDPYKAAHAAAYQQDTNPFPVTVPPALKELVESPAGDPLATGRAGNPFLRASPDDGEAFDTGPPPLIPKPDIGKEIVLPTAFDPQVMPDETVGADVSPYFFQTKAGSPENVYNPYPVQQPPSIEAIMAKKV